MSLWKYLLSMMDCCSKDWSFSLLVSLRGLLRKACVFKTTPFIFPLWVWHVSSPLYNSSGLWENGNLVAPTRITLEPYERNKIFFYLLDKIPIPIDFKTSCQFRSTLYGVFVEGIRVDFVLLISNKHTLTVHPVFPQHPFNSRWEVWDLKERIIYLQEEQTLLSLHC